MQQPIQTNECAHSIVDLGLHRSDNDAKNVYIPYTAFRPLDRSKRMTYPCQKKPATNLQNGRLGNRQGVSEKRFRFKKSAKDRDQLQLLQQAAAAGEFDVLLVFMFDRLGRRDDETPFIVEWFTKQGVEVWSVNEGEQRFDSHVDKLMNYIRYWQASGESIKTSIRTRTRIEQLTEEGHYTGGTVAFGYKRVQKRPLEQKESSCLRFGNQRGRSGNRAPDLSEVCL